MGILKYLKVQLVKAIRTNYISTIFYQIDDFVTSKDLIRNRNSIKISFKSNLLILTAFETNFVPFVSSSKLFFCCVYRSIASRTSWYFWWLERHFDLDLMEKKFRLFNQPHTKGLFIVCRLFTIYNDILFQNILNHVCNIRDLS